MLRAPGILAWMMRHRLLGLILWVRTCAVGAMAPLECLRGVEFSLGVFSAVSLKRRTGKKVPRLLLLMKEVLEDRVW